MRDKEEEEEEEEEEEGEALKDRKPPPRQLIRSGKIHTFPLSRSGKNSVKNSWIRIVNRISTEIERSVASETSHSSKNFIKKLSTTLELCETFVLYCPCAAMVKMPLKILESVS